MNASETRKRLRALSRRQYPFNLVNEKGHGVRPDVTEAGHRVVPWVALAAVLCMLYLLTGCNDSAGDSPPAVREANNRDVLMSGSDVMRYGPDEHGVTCYRPQGMAGISCVKVK